METATLTPPAGFSSVFKNADLFMGLAVMCILVVMIIPVHPALLDFMLSFNITFSVVILLVGMYVIKPLEFSAFPSILLLATLLRLALNVASTRIILLHGNEGVQAAGKVIHSFGSVVVGGNYAVGVIIFLILVIINFIVITKGAGRIAEVAARFTLDAMPGKQMSIDADLNAGLISEREARERRNLIAQESEYYGAMDGANKFVRGDAIAGIIITLINIVAGLGVGVFQNGMSFAEASQTYTLLTVGDGLVTQIPALVVSTAAGIVVSRAGTDTSLGISVIYQLLFQPRAIAIASVILLCIGLFPGLPTIPFIVLSFVCGITAYWVYQTRQQETATTSEESDGPQEERPEKAYLLEPLDPLALDVGYGLIPLVDPDQKGELLDRIKSVRRHMAREIGIIIPSVHIQDNMQLKAGEYAINLKGNEIARGEVMLHHHLAMNTDGDQTAIEGIETKEPTYGLPAKWIREEQKEAVLSQGFTVVNAPTVLVTHLSEVMRQHAHELIGRQETQEMLENIKRTYPKVVEELVPNLLPLGAVVKVLQNLLREKIPIRDMLTILETLADWAPVQKSIDLLTEHVRQALSRTITNLHQTPDGKIFAITLGRSAEHLILESIHKTDQGDLLALPPEKAHQLINELAKGLEKFSSVQVQPAVLCAAEIRLHLKKFIDRFLAGISILSFNEILNSVQIQSLGTVEISSAD
jgi:flagellar biosynthesis protein FlhA